MIKSNAINAVAARRGNSLTVIVQDEIERMIVEGEMAPGQHINEQHIATQLGVSRGPVREALRGLERSGLVAGLTNLGMFVRNLGVSEVVELYELRAMLFGFACAALAEHCDAEQLSALRKLIADMDAAIANNASADYYKLNLEFHDRIMEFSKRARAVHIYQSLVKESHLFRQSGLVSASSMRVSNEEHAAIVDAIEAGNTAMARAAAEKHHANGKQRWLNTLGRRED